MVEEMEEIGHKYEAETLISNEFMNECIHYSVKYINLHKFDW